MKAASLQAGLLFGALLFGLTGCINYPRTHVLVTPIGVAGIHSFAPVNRQRKGEVNLQAHNNNDSVEENDRSDQSPARR